MQLKTDRLIREWQFTVVLPFPFYDAVNQIHIEIFAKGGGQKIILLFLVGKTVEGL